MKKEIEAIRGVVGVSGVILWDKRANAYHKILPARLEHDNADQLCKLLVRFCELREKDTRSVARFQRGWLFLHDYRNYALLILGKADLNTTTLNLVTKSAVSALDAKLGTGAMVASADATSFAPEHAAILVRAINLSLGHFQSQISRFEIAEMLRQIKTELLESYPALKHFSVDANGGIILIKGAEKHLDHSAVETATQLILTFVNHARSRCDISAFDIETLTAALYPTLARLGFYSGFVKSRQARTH